ncbi:MAG TPA: hypothetical protein ENK31_02840 [Nannocystis exedens]|nr:hypothetical protein [Nannocystis exedens]
MSLLIGNARAAPETHAERLYRKGVHCMEVIERSKCAIERFAELLDEDTPKRALITDAILRLVKLYREEDLDEELRAVLRRFWRAGGRRKRSGHLPYSARFLPADLDVVGHIDIQRALAAPMLQRLPPELAEAMTTCDEDRRAALGDALLVRRAQRRTEGSSMTTAEALAEITKEDNEQRERYKKRQAAREKQSGTPESAPVFANSLCATALALGSDSTETWTRAAFALNHQDPRRSAAVVMIPDLARQIQQGVAAGRLRPVSDRRWQLVDHSYEDEPVEIASFDLDELTLAPAAMMPTIAGATADGKATLNRRIAKLISTTPKDLAFFAVTTGEALQDLGLSEQKGSRRRLLEALLPRPQGLQIAGAAHEYLGLFMRMPTDNPVKVQLLIDLATRLLAAEEDEATAKMLRNLDLAQASDRRALLISYVLSPTQIEDLLLQ